MQLNNLDYTGGLKKMLTQLGQSTTVNDCKVMIGRFDVNGDGVLDFDEFRAMMN